MKIIKVPYTPSITNESIMDILQREYPTKKISKFFNQVRIKQNALRVAQIVVIHNAKKNLTQISVSATFPFWVGGTIVIPILFIGLGSYSLFGNWATEITGKLRLRLQNPIQTEKPRDIATPKSPNPTQKRTEQPSKVSFAKFSNPNID